MRHRFMSWVELVISFGCGERLSVKVEARSGSPALRISCRSRLRPSGAAGGLLGFRLGAVGDLPDRDDLACLQLRPSLRELRL
jgi:hypothetical protein